MSRPKHAGDILHEEETRAERFHVSEVVKEQCVARIVYAGIVQPMGRETLARGTAEENVAISGLKANCRHDIERIKIHDVVLEQLRVGATRRDKIMLVSRAGVLVLFDGGDNFHSCKKRSQRKSSRSGEQIDPDGPAAPIRGIRTASRSNGRDSVHCVAEFHGPDDQCRIPRRISQREAPPAGMAASLMG